MNEPNMRGAIVVLSPGVLRHLLGLPEGAIIDGISAPIDEWGTVHLRILGAGWQCEPGSMLVRTSSQVATRQDGDGATWFRAWCDLPPPEPPKEEEAPANG